MAALAKTSARSLPWPKGGHFEFDQVEIFQDASSAEISHFIL